MTIDNNWHPRDNWLTSMTHWHIDTFLLFFTSKVELWSWSEVRNRAPQLHRLEFSWIPFVHFVSNVSNGKSAKGIGWVKLDTDLRQKQTHPLDGIWATFGERECSGGNPYRGVSIPFKQSETSGKLRKGLQWEGTQERIKCDRNTKKWTSPAPHFAPRAKVLLVLLSHRRKSNA